VCRTVAAAGLALVAAGTGVGSAHAQRDFDPDSPAWNGLSELVEVARDEEVSLRIPERVDLDQLRPRDSLLIVHPSRSLPEGGIVRFLRAGGRVAIADDFGTGSDLLKVYGITRSTPSDEGAPRLRGNPALPLATPAAEAAHPLTEGIRALVTNHPTTLRHAELRPLFRLDAEEAVVLAGAVDEGRFVAVGDPSLLINNMMQFRDNRRFAGNLLRYLDRGGRGRVLLVTNDTPLIGRFDGAGGAPMDRVQDWLRQLARADVPPLALRLGSLMLVALLVLVSTSSLPRRSPYSWKSLLPRAPVHGGLVGRVRFFAERPGHLLHPLVVYKFELEEELIRRLELEGRPLLRDVVDALRSRGMSERDVDDLRSLLVELDELRSRQDRPPDPPRISPARFHRMVQRGEGVLARLPPRPDKV
jgi:hypothetical protein